MSFYNEKKSAYIYTVRSARNTVNNKNEIIHIRHTFGPKTTEWRLEKTDEESPITDRLHLFFNTFFQHAALGKATFSLDTGPTSTNVLLKLITSSSAVAVGLRVWSCCEENLRHWRGAVVHPSVV